MLSREQSLVNVIFKLSLSLQVTGISQGKKKKLIYLSSPIFVTATKRVPLECLALEASRTYVAVP